MKNKTTFISDGLQIEAIFEKKSSEKGIIITHPHSLYGGNMYNAIVEVIYRVYSRNDYSSLRFNFRGVGESQGTYDDGNGEINEVKAAYDFMKENQILHIDLAGYSFGSWVNGKAVNQENSFHNLIMVSPPVSFMDFSKILPIDNLILTIAGDRDEFAHLPDLESVQQKLNSNALHCTIEGADHFYTGYTDELEKIIMEKSVF